MKIRLILFTFVSYFFLAAALVGLWLLAMAIPSASDLANKLPTHDSNYLINVVSPRPGQTITSPVRIAGLARGSWYFEASFPAKIVDDNGFVLAQLPITAKSDWMTTALVPFDQMVSWAKPSTPAGQIILQKDNPSGLPGNDASVTVPIRFADFINGATTTVKIHLSDSSSVNSPEFDCGKTKSVVRVVPKTAEVGRAALEALLRGVTNEEAAAGLISSLPSGVRLNSLVIKNGVATADFNDQLNYQMGGSCRVTSVRAQIENTLKQFPAVKQVVITANGDPDVLQP